MDQGKIDRSEAAATGVGIAARGLGYRVEGTTILSDVTFRTEARRVGVIGRNGSGKSTLARLLAGLVTPTSGEVRIDGHDLARDRRAALTTVGILFQNPDHQIIFPTVLEEVSFGLVQQGHSRAEAEAAARATLDRFAKAHWADAATNALSQGQKHLLCLISVVAMAPRVLILDEPFSGLDLATRLQLRRYLAAYSGTLLHISHEPEELRAYHHLIWLDRGAIRQEGAPSSVLPAYLDEMERLGGDDDISDLAR